MLTVLERIIPSSAKLSSHHEKYYLVNQCRLLEFVHRKIIYFYVCTDFRGGFHLQPVQNTQQGHSSHVPPSCFFTPLLDVPIDSYTSSAMRSRSLSSLPSTSSVCTDSSHSSHNGRQPHRSPNRRQNGMLRHNEASLLSMSDRRDVGPERGRSPVRKADRGRARTETSPDSMDGRLRKREDYTEVSIRVPSQRRLRTPLADIFQLQREKNPSTGRASSQGLNGAQRSSYVQPAEYETKTVPIYKSRPSLGEFNRKLTFKHLNTYNPAFMWPSVYDF